jgi:hypothetical protein
VKKMQERLEEYMSIFRSQYKQLPLNVNSRSAPTYQRTITSAHQVLQWPVFSQFLQEIHSLRELQEQGYCINEYPTWLEMGQERAHEWDYGQREAGAYTDSTNDKLSQLYKLYVQNMHCLYPFLDPTKLERLIGKFNIANNLRPIERAIVFLVAAIGELYTTSYINKSQVNRARPGLAYYAQATAILAFQQEGISMEHAQAQILAALYLSQEARIKESWHRISTACRIILMMASP